MPLTVTVQRSGSAAPETRRSPNPATASITVWCSPLTGSVVKATPAAWAGIIGCIRTAIDPELRSPAYVLTRSDRADCQQRSTASTSSSVCTLRKLSNWPANDA